VGCEETKSDATTGNSLLLAAWMVDKVMVVPHCDMNVAKRCKILPGECVITLLADTSSWSLVIALVSC
jgi:hypothetical protein